MTDTGPSASGLMKAGHQDPSRKAHNMKSYLQVRRIQASPVHQLLIFHAAKTASQIHLPISTTPTDEPDADSSSNNNLQSISRLASTLKPDTQPPTDYQAAHQEEGGGSQASRRPWTEKASQETQLSNGGRTYQATNPQVPQDPHPQASLVQGNASHSKS
jgi:hypothetical protein